MVTVYTGWCPKKFAEGFYISSRAYAKVIALDAKLFIDGKEVDLNEFVRKILSGTIVGAVTSLRDIRKDWKEIDIKVKR
jgi:hypothetical protein